MSAGAFTNTIQTAYQYSPHKEHKRYGFCLSAFCFKPSLSPWFYCFACEQSSPRKVKSTPRSPENLPAGQTATCRQDCLISEFPNPTGHFASQFPAFSPLLQVEKTITRKPSPARNHAQGSYQEGVCQNTQVMTEKTTRKPPRDNIITTAQCPWVAVLMEANTLQTALSGCATQKCLLWAEGNNSWTKEVCAAKQLHSGYDLREVLGCLATFKTQALVISLYHMPTLSIFQETPPHQIPAAGAQPIATKGQPKYPLLHKHKRSKQTKEKNCCLSSTLRQILHFLQNN